MSDEEEEAVSMDNRAAQIPLGSHPPMGYVSSHLEPASEGTGGFEYVPCQSVT